MSPKHQTSEIYLETSDLMLKHQKWQYWLSLLYCELYISNIVQYNCHATKSFFLIAQHYQCFLFCYLFSTSYITNWRTWVWMRHDDLVNFIMTHHHTEAKNHFPKKARNPQNSRNPNTCFVEPKVPPEPLLKSTGFFDSNIYATSMAQRKG